MQVRVKVDTISNDEGARNSQATSEATVEPIAHAVSGILTAVQRGEENPAQVEIFLIID